MKELATEQHRRRRHTAFVVADSEITGPHDRSFKAVVTQAHRQWRHERRSDRAAEIFRRYPAAENVMPTQLGNVLRRGEDNAGSRYELNFNAIAPRLWPSVSPELASAINRNLDLIDTMSAVCIASGVTLLAALPLAAHPSGWMWVIPIAAAMTAIAYRAALRAATGHATLLATAVDLHRFDMLTALHYQLPTSTVAEVEFNRQLSDFFAKDGDISARQKPRLKRYKHGSRSPQPDGTA